MIDDIVVLPSRLSQVKHGSDVTSEIMVSPPISCISRVVGYNEPDDTTITMYGGKTYLPGGKDVPTRFKIVEIVPNGICEFFCISTSPIDPFRLYRCKNVRFNCLWVLFKGRNGLTRKYILWRNVFEINHFEVEDSIADTPVETVIANEVVNFARVYGCPEICTDIDKYPTNWQDTLISEVQATPVEGYEKLEMLNANIRAFNFDWDDMPFHGYCDPTDIFRGVDIPQVWTDLTPIKCSSVLPFVQFGSTTIGEVIHLCSPRYGMHLIQRPAPHRIIEPSVITDILDCNDANKLDLFQVIKYMEQLPYSEFQIVIHDNGKCDLHVPETVTKDSKIVGSVIVGELKKMILSLVPGLKECILRKSWEEEIYITFMYNNGKKTSFFYDLAVMPLCSRSLIRDYNGYLSRNLGF